MDDIPVVAVRDTKDLAAARQALEDADGPVLVRIQREGLAVVKALADDGELWADAKDVHADEALDMAVAGASRIVLHADSVAPDMLDEMGDVLGPSLAVVARKADAALAEKLMGWGAALIVQERGDAGDVECYLDHGSRLETLHAAGDGDDAAGDAEE
ncbi:MAG: hypothetical protein QOD77_1816 [Thermoplasmata archaeon]|jgi:hypothetical protein|nr:hypothetical protein [Thermoplasmata archaeon]